MFLCVYSHYTRCHGNVYLIKCVTWLSLRRRTGNPTVLVVQKRIKPACRTAHFLCLSGLFQTYQHGGRSNFLLSYLPEISHLEKAFHLHSLLRSKAETFEIFVDIFWFLNEFSI